MCIRDRAAGTPLAESLQKMDAPPLAQTDAQPQMPGQEQAATPRRAAM